MFSFPREVVSIGLSFFCMVTFRSFLNKLKQTTNRIDKFSLFWRQRNILCYVRLKDTGYWIYYQFTVTLWLWSKQPRLKMSVPTSPAVLMLSAARTIKSVSTKYGAFMYKIAYCGIPFHSSRSPHLTFTSVNTMIPIKAKTPYLPHRDFLMLNNFNGSQALMRKTTHLQWGLIARNK